MGQVRKAVSERPEPLNRLRTALTELAEQYDARYLASDPLRFPHLYEKPADREAVAFLSAMLAFGNVRAIFRSIEFLLAILDPSPSARLAETGEAMDPALQGFKHRWVTAQDMHRFSRFLGEIYRTDGSIEAFFQRGYRPGEGALAPAVDSFAERAKIRLRELGDGRALTPGLRFLLASPSGGSTCKRFSLFLRWVVRDRSPDLGLWRGIRPAELFLPLDTHLSRLVRYLGLSDRKTAGWPMVLEATAFLRRIDALDPTRFDFALARLGILDRCRHRPDPVCCPACPLSSLCTLNKGLYLAAA